MKLTAPLVGALFLVGFSVLADPAVIIRERAKDLRNQNNANQGVPTPAQPQPGQPAVTPPAPAGPTLSPALVRFNTQLTAIRAEAPASADQQQKLAQELLQAPQGGKPSLATASKLATDIAAAFAEKPLPAPSRARLVQELDAVLNPAKYPQAKVDGILKDIQAMFQDNGLARMKAFAIAEDVRRIAEEVRKGGA